MLMLSKKSSRTKRENFFLVLLIIYISGMASGLAFSPVFLVLSLMYAVYIFLLRRIEVDRFFIVLTYIYGLITLIYYAQFGWVDIPYSGYYFLKILFAYLVIKIVREDFFELYEKIICALALISLPFYTLQVLSYDLTISLLDGIEQLIESVFPFWTFYTERYDYANVFVFTLNGAGPLRNSGFAWESKGFANFLVIAMIFNLARNQMRITWRMMVYIIALMTTISTTAYLATFFLLPMFYLYNAFDGKKAVYLAVFSPILISAFIYLISQDFMLDKIKYEISSRDNYVYFLNDPRDFPSRSLGRFPSLMLDIQDFKKYPVFGYGQQRSERTQHDYVKLTRVNGFSDRLATWGGIGILFFFITYYMGFKNFLKSHGCKGAALVVLIVFALDFASTVHSHPIWMLYYFIFLVPMNFAAQPDRIPNKLTWHGSGSRKL